MRIGGKEFDLKKNTYIMGILNVTPDSFSDGGRYDGLDRAIEHTKQMIQEGVDIIDVGGESTRPGHVQITEEEEIARVVPVIRKLKKEFDIPVSIDTYKSAVAAAAIEAGADLVNDIWGLKYDSEMAGLIAKTGVACCLMHNRENTDYQNFLADFMDDKDVDLIGVEAGGLGIETGKHASAMALGEPGVLHGMKSYLLQDEAGNIKLAHSISAGLDYPGVGPEHAYLRDSGRAQYVSITDSECMDAFMELCKEEGIIPAIESAHALAHVLKMAQGEYKGKTIVMCLSGRGDKDVHTVQKYLKGEETNK